VFERHSLCAQVKGYIYATMMLVGLVTGSLCDNQHFQRVVRAGFRLRGVLTHEVFRKVRVTEVRV
jgi:hypothetical protein